MQIQLVETKNKYFSRRYIINKQIFIVLQELDKYNDPTLQDGTKDV